MFSALAIASTGVLRGQELATSNLTTQFESRLLAKYQAFLAAQARREAWVREREVVVLETVIGSTSKSSPHLAIVRFDGNFENWRRFRGLFPPTEAESPTAVLDWVSHSGLRPVIERFDGVRSITIAPVPGHPRSWQATLNEPGNTVFREGALHYGYMSGETWLSELLPKLRMTFIREVESRCEVGLSRGESGIGMMFAFDEELRLRFVVDQHGSEVKMRVDIDDYLEGAQLSGLVSRGRRLANYFQSIAKSAAIDYRPRESGDSWNDSLLELPPLLRNVGGTMRVADVTTGMEFDVVSNGDMSVVQEVRSETPREVGQREVESAQRSASFFGWFTVGLVAVAIVILLSRHCRAS
jgi:hypothetical protein